MSFVAITLCISSQRVFLVVSFTFLYRLSPETFGYTLVWCLCEAGTASLRQQFSYAAFSYSRRSHDTVFKFWMTITCALNTLTLIIS